MAAYIEHIRALAQRIHLSDTLPLHWHEDNSDEGLYYFLAQKMEMAGLLNVEQNGTCIAVQGLTARGRKLIDASSTPSAEFLNDIHEALYQEVSYNDAPSSGVNRPLNSA